MAKILNGGGVAEIRGSQAGNTFSRNRGGAYLRNRVTPINPSTPAQQAVRSSLSELTTAWGVDLTQAQRDGWIAFAEAWPTTDVFGASIILTGLQMYTRQNMQLLQAGLDRIDTAPLNLDVEGLSTVEVEVDGAALNVTFTPAPLSEGNFVQVFATPPIQPGISFVKNRLRLIFTGADESASPADVAAEYVAAFGALPVVGQKCVIEARVISGVTGAVCTSLQATAIPE